MPCHLYPLPGGEFAIQISSFLENFCFQGGNLLALFWFEPISFALQILYSPFKLGKGLLKLKIVSHTHASTMAELFSGNLAACIQAQNSGKGWAQQTTRHHLIKHAMCLHKLSSICIRGQVRMHKLLNHAWPSKANQRPRLSQNHIPQKGKTGRNAASRRVGQERDIGQTRL